METEMTNNRRKGQVARLPKVLRDKVNTMLDDGATYSQIVAELKNSTNPPLPHSVNEDNIGNWQKGGYQDYLRNQTWAEAIRGTQEKVLSAAAEDPVKFADAGVQLAATGICELLAELSRLQSTDEKASDRYARIANSMARLAKTILAYEHHRRVVAKEKAAEPKQLDPNRELDDNEHLAIVDRVNRLFGLRQYRKPATSTSERGHSCPREFAPPASAPTYTDDRACAADVPPSPAPISQISNLKSEIPSSTDLSPSAHRAKPSAPLSESQISNLKSEILEVSPTPLQPPATTLPAPITETEREERRPWNWHLLSNEGIDQWRKEHNL